MFDETDIRSAQARAMYKHYVDRSVIHPPVFKEVEYVLVQRPSIAAKTAQEKEDDMGHSKLRYKITGPYRVISSTPETITVKYNDEHVNVSNDRCINDPKPEREDPDRQGDGEQIRTTNYTARTDQPPTPAEDPASLHGQVNSKSITEHRPA